MLFDPNKAGIYSTANFAAWLKTQPPRKEYNYAYKETCAVAQYLKAHGVKNYALSNKEVHALGWYNIVNATPSTFGSAAKRAAEHI